MRQVSTPALTRRFFLRCLLVASSLVLLPSRMVGSTDPRVQRSPAPADATEGPPPVGGLDGVDAVATVYLHQYPEEASMTALRASLDLGPDDDPRREARRLARRAKADFETRDVVSIDGWRLSRSEARWAALLHLERSA